MPGEENQCEQHFYAHEEAIKQNKADIEKLYKLLNGLPQDVKHILDAISNLNETLNKADEKYVSKEVMELKLDNLNGKIKLWIISTVGLVVINVIICVNYLYRMFGG